MKTAIVTGGSKGIGLAVARMLVGRGYKVYATYAHDDSSAIHAETDSQGRIVFFKADHSDRTQTYDFVDYVKENVEQIDCIVCNAGITVRHSFAETTDREWDAMMEVALNSHFIILREFFPLISTGARILFTGSAMAIYPHATVLGYGVSKSAVHSIAENLVKVFEEKQATVNVIAPGFVETEWHRNKLEDIRQNICRKTAIHRFATTDEIVNAFEFCLDNEFVNGSVIEVNGGYSYK